MNIIKGYIIVEHIKTQYEILVEYLNTYKNETYLFLGINNNQENNKLEKQIAWTKSNIEAIFNKLNTYDVIFNISNFNLSEYGKKNSTFNPTIILKSKKFNSLSIEIHHGRFFDRFKIYDDDKDYIQLEPHIKTNYFLSKEQTQFLIDTLKIVNLELTKYHFNNHQKLEMI